MVIGLLNVSSNSNDAIVIVIQWSLAIMISLGWEIYIVISVLL